MGITCDLYRQWIDAIRGELAKVGFDHSGLPDQDCAIAWQSWQRRKVRACPRKIYKTKSFVCPTHLQGGLVRLEQSFASGTDIWPWQSKQIDKPTSEDGLYNDYSIQHFHLGDSTESSGFATRTKELLFALITADAVFEVGIYNHGDWYELDILDIIDDNWPKLLDRVTITGIDAVNCPSTREEVKKIRAAHLVSLMKLKSGRYIAPLGGGVATNGTSIDAVRAAYFWAKAIRNGERLIVDDIVSQIKSGALPDVDHVVLLHATDDIICGVMEGQKWTLWKKGPN